MQTSNVIDAGRTVGIGLALGYERGVPAVPQRASASRRLRSSHNGIISSARFVSTCGRRAIISSQADTKVAAKLPGNQRPAYRNR